MLNQIITFTITATLRPSVLQKSLKSFQKNLLDIKLNSCRAVINIDPVPPKFLSQQQDVLNVCKSFFADVVYRFSEKPNFCEAVRWVWSQCETEYVFHLEDDWKLVKDLQVQDVLKLFDENSELNQVRLRKRPDNKGLDIYGLSPCLIRKKFYSQLVKTYDTNKNPEKQLIETDRLGILPPSPRSVLCYPLLNNKTDKAEVIIIDIGREWRFGHNVSKLEKKDEINFLTWIYPEKVIR